MRGKDYILDIAHQVLRASEFEETEVVVFSEKTNLTRFANSTIHQNTSFDNIRIGLRVREGKKVAVSWTNNRSKEGILSLVKNCRELLEHAAEDPELPELQEPGNPMIFNSHAVYKETLEAGPELASSYAKTLFKTVGERGKAFGIVSYGLSEMSYMNSLGAEYYHALTDAHLTLMVKVGDVSAWSQSSSPDISKINPESLAQKTLERALLAQNPQDLKPGKYPVILEPLAMASLVDYMGYFTFSARAVLEKRSYLHDKLGKKAFSEKITLVDEPLIKEGFPMPFDFEGVAKRNLVFVDRGFARNIAHNLHTAMKMGVKSTGHQLFPFHNFPFPGHLNLEPGQESIESILEKVGEAILVTRLWYVNVIDPVNITFTGMTRDGTFLVKNGKIVHALKNLRFTQSIAELFNEDRLQLSREREFVAETSYYGLRLPAGSFLPYGYFPEFNFTGATEF